jgi:hypothetical protein
MLALSLSLCIYNNLYVAIVDPYLLVQTSLDQLLFIQQTLFSFYKNKLP